MANPLQEFTPERWETIRSILSGESGSKVSMTAAAREAGITLGTLKAWVRRSERKDPGDDPLIHDIAEFMKEVDRLQADTLEDVVWQRAIEGVDHPVIHKGQVVDSYKKVDNKLLLRLLETREPKYRSTSQHVSVSLSDPSEIHARLLAGHRIALANEAREKQINLSDKDYEVIPDKDIPPEGLPDEFMNLPEEDESSPFEDLDL